MKIWGRANSINVMKVLWCADECGLKYERENVGLQYGGNDQKWYLDMNPNGVVPTIEDAGRIVYESNTIVRYLAAKYGAGTLWPNDPGLLLSRAVLLGRMKRYDEALAVLDDMAKQASNGRLGANELAEKGRLLDQMGRYDDAFAAFSEGKRQGLAGESIKNPHHHTTEAHRAHQAGYDAGQAINAGGIKPLDQEASADIKKAASIGSSRPSFQVQ